MLKVYANYSADDHTKKLARNSLIVDYTVPTDTTSITISNLDLVAAGGIYELLITGSGTASDPTININGNQVASDWSRQNFGQSVGTFYGSNNADNLLPGFRIDADFVVDYKIVKNSCSGKITIIGSWENGSNVGGNFMYYQKMTSKYAIDNMTSFVISGGSTIKAGTKIKIWRKD